jgi:hypothetical protein
LSLQSNHYPETLPASEPRMSPDDLQALVASAQVNVAVNAHLWTEPRARIEVNDGHEPGVLADAVVILGPVTLFLSREQVQSLESQLGFWLLDQTVRHWPACLLCQEPVDPRTACEGQPDLHYACDVRECAACGIPCKSRLAGTRPAAIPEAAETLVVTSNGPDPFAPELGGEAGAA